MDKPYFSDQLVVGATALGGQMPRTNELTAAKHFNGMSTPLITKELFATVTALGGELYDDLPRWASYEFNPPLLSGFRNYGLNLLCHQMREKGWFGIFRPLDGEETDGVIMFSPYGSLPGDAPGTIRPVWRVDGDRLDDRLLGGAVYIGAGTRSKDGTLLPPRAVVRCSESSDDAYFFDLTDPEKPLYLEANFSPVSIRPDIVAESLRAHVRQCAEFFAATDGFFTWSVVPGWKNGWNKFHRLLCDGANKTETVSPAVAVAPTQSSARAK